ncbi:hypothetical protein ACFYVL_11675 [Streptomyces sp. NPDC004111]|uniref:hypothetical protein n=1 Tax=Streptomyces sp. NPDC004111 TaxID=3364690 RepID=UPI0036CC84E9
MSVALLLATAATAAVGGAALYTVAGLRKEVAALRADRAADRAEAAALRDKEALAALPHQTRSSDTPLTPAAEIRAAVTEALAEERERELAEARAFWAAQEARDAADAPSLLTGFTTAEQDSFSYLGPEPADFFEGMDDGELQRMLQAAQARADAEDAAEAAAEDFPEDSAELAAARRRHPSHPDFVPVRRSAAVAGDDETTLRRLEELAEARVVLSDIRPGPLGTLDMYVFTDGTTLGMTPGHRDTAELLGQALRDGNPPVLLGGSSLSGAYALTFSCGEDNVYILADRVIASMPEQ